MLSQFEHTKTIFLWVNFDVTDAYYVDMWLEVFDLCGGGETVVTCFPWVIMCCIFDTVLLFNH